MTTITKLTTRPAATNYGGPSCSGWFSLVSSCEARTPGLLNEPFEQQASCLCYGPGSSSSAWQPGVYDGYQGSCLSFLSTDDPSLYTSLGGDDQLTDPCAVLGNFRGAPTAAAGGDGAGIITSAPAAYPPCVTWDALSSLCAARTSGFTDLPFVSQAGCLCYVNGSFAPAAFDQPFAECIAYLDSADPSLATVQAQSGAVITTPCANLARETASTATTATATASTTAPTATVPVRGGGVKRGAGHSSLIMSVAIAVLTIVVLVSI